MDRILAARQTLNFFRFGKDCLRYQVLPTGKGATLLCSWIVGPSKGFKSSTYVYPEEYRQFGTFLQPPRSPDLVGIGLRILEIDDGIFTLRKRQSSAIGAPRLAAGWGQAFPKVDASIIELEALVIGIGALNRSWPTGGNAKGIPSHFSVPFDVDKPLNVPVFSLTSIVFWPWEKQQP